MVHAPALEMFLRGLNLSINIRRGADWRFLGKHGVPDAPSIEHIKSDRIAALLRELRACSTSPQRVLLLGGFGAPNLGDEAIQAAISTLYSLRGNANLVVSSANSDYHAMFPPPIRPPFLQVRS